MKNPTETEWLTENQILRCAILGDPYKIYAEVILPNLEDIEATLGKGWEPLALAHIAHYKVNSVIKSKVSH